VIEDLGFGDLIRSSAELAEVYGPPSNAARRKTIDHLETHCRAFLAASPLVLIATTGGDGRCDVSPRGGPAGFVAAVDERRSSSRTLPGTGGSSRFATSSRTGTSVLSSRAGRG
jgi:uncharacterized protein